MKNKNAVIIPSKKRAHKIVQVIKSIFDNSLESDVYVGLDYESNEINDYVKLYKNSDLSHQVYFTETDSNSMIECLNQVALNICLKYQTLTFLGDDHIVRTYGWDSTLMKPLYKRLGISYANDLNQGEKIPTSVMINAEIVSKLGYFANPIFEHLYVDNAWKKLGEGLDHINYFSDVIIEHMHYTLGKSELDQQYEKNNSHDKYIVGEQIYNYYIESILDKEIKKLRI
jgi:hypothetical protein